MTLALALSELLKIVRRVRLMDALSMLLIFVGTCFLTHGLLTIEPAYIDQGRNYTPEMWGIVGIGLVFLGLYAEQECLHEETHQRLSELIEQHVPEGWRLQMNDVLPTWLGVAATEHETKTIHMRKDCGLDPEDAVRTVFHEIAHALIPMSATQDDRGSEAGR